MFRMPILFLGVVASLAATSNPLTPGAIMPITDATYTDDPIEVAGTAAGFMATYPNIGNAPYASFYNGTSWSDAPTAIVTTYTPDTFFSIGIGGTTAGFIAAWIDGNVGFSTAIPVASFATTASEGTVWSAPVSLSADPVHPPVSVSGVDGLGFVATWEGNDSNGYASFTGNNGTSWSGSPIALTDSGLVVTPVMVGGSTAGFVATWQQADNNAYASFSADGTSWSGSPIQLTNDGSLDSDADVWVSGSPAGFVATWTNSSEEAYSSFSTDGTSWNTPVYIASNVQEHSDVTITGVLAGFVAAWVGSDYNVYGSFSSDHGVSWSTPVPITDDGSVGHYSDEALFVGVSAVGHDCMFVWRNDSQAAQSCLVTIAGAAPGRQRKSDSFYNQIQPNRPTQKLF